MSEAPDPCDVLVVGAGAAGLATAIFAAASAPAVRVRCVDGARRIGAKILVSGGSRCNVTNRVVSERDFWGGAPRLVRNVLRAFPAERAAAFFQELGVALHEEEDGKLFPDSNTARTVLDALLGEAHRLGVVIDSGCRVTGIRRLDGMFHVDHGALGAGSPIAARTVVLATGGRSLPKSGSDGFGYALAAGFGHRCEPTTPALAPLVLRGQAHRALAGVSHPASVALRVNGTPVVRLEAPLLWTHFGVSGPLALNLSRHWHRVQLELGTADSLASRTGPPDIEVLLSVLPGETFESIERWLLDETQARPRAQLSTVLSLRLPHAIADVWLDAAGVGRDTTMSHFARDARRRLARALVETPLDIEDSRGYAYAEVTAGGIPLEEIDTATMESRLQPGLFLAGEILDVDGRLGGFNFQWAWSSGWVAGRAAARAALVSRT